MLYKDEAMHTSRFDFARSLESTRVLRGWEICTDLFAPFGLWFGPTIILQILKGSIQLFRWLDIHLVIYLDDILLMGRTLEEILISRDALIFLLQKLGFVISVRKSIPELTWCSITLQASSCRSKNSNGV